MSGRTEVFTSVRYCPAHISYATGEIIPVEYNL